MPDLIPFCDKMSGFVGEEGAVAVLHLAFSQALITASHCCHSWLDCHGLGGSQVGEKLLVAPGSEPDEGLDHYPVPVRS